MDFRCSDAAVWRDALASYPTRVESLSLAKTDLVSLDDFYTKQLPLLLRQRNPTPYISKPELSTLMQWKLTRGKWRPRLMDFVSSLDEPQVQSASERAFQSLPDIAKAITELTTLKGVGPATASAVLAAYAPEIAPFMSDEAMVSAIGSSKDYTLKQYLIFAEKLQTKAKVVFEEGGKEEFIAFPSLKTICLLQLPKLQSICSGSLPKLEQLKVKGCSKLEKIPLQVNKNPDAIPVEIRGDKKWLSNINFKGDEEVKQPHIIFKPWRSFYRVIFLWM